MKRAAALLLLVALPVVLVLFPRLRRALARRSRLLLLILSGAILASGLARLVAPGPMPELTGTNRLLALAGLALLALSFLLVARDARRS